MDYLAEGLKLSQESGEPRMTFRMLAYIARLERDREISMRLEAESKNSSR